MSISTGAIVRTWREVRSPTSSARQPVELQTDGHGRVLEVPLCLDCEAPVPTPRSWRCSSCKAKRQTVYGRRWREKNLERVQERERARPDRARTDERRAREREYRRRNRERINANRRRRNQANREEHLRKRREWKARNPGSVKRSQDKANRKRRVAARQYMHDYATKYVGLDCAPPTCRQCGREIPYNGRGRPRLDCETCRPPRRRASAGVPT